MGETLQIDGGLIRVKDNKLVTGSSCCCVALCYDCSECNSNTTHCQYQVDIPSTTNNGCASCASFAGTYILTQTGASCQFRYTLPSPICGVTDIFLALNFPGVVRVTISAVVVAASWTASVANPLDCGFTGLTLTCASGAVGNCNCIGTTVTVSAI